MIVAALLRELVEDEENRGLRRVQVPRPRPARSRGRLGALSSRGSGPREVGSRARRGRVARGRRAHVALEVTGEMGLVVEADVRRERTEDGKKNSELKHRLNSEKSLGLRTRCSLPTAVRAIGFGAFLLNRPFGQRLKGLDVLASAVTH